MSSQISSPGTAWLNWILCLEAPEAKTKLLLGLCSFREALEINLLLSSLRLLTKFSSLCL